MMPRSAEIAPPNSLILVVGSKNPDIPRSFGDALIVATSSCIAIGCKTETDGTTLFTLGRASEMALSGKPAFIGRLNTPDGTVALETVFGYRIAEQAVAGGVADISVWVNDPNEPDEIAVAVGCE